MPKGFSVSRRFLSRQEAQDAVQLCFEIAAGPHGFGDLVNGNLETQIIFVAVGDPDVPEFGVDAMMAELDEVVASASIGSRAIVLGLADPRISLRNAP